MAMHNPPHIGDFIRTEIVEAHGLTVTGGALALGVTRQALSTLLNGHAGLSPAMALRIEKAFGVKMDTLLRMQTAYEIAQARAMEREIDVPRFMAA
jgi:addiction module HigA family antidote